MFYLISCFFLDINVPWQLSDAASIKNLEENWLRTFKNSRTAEKLIGNMSDQLKIVKVHTVNGTHFSALIRSLFQLKGQRALRKQSKILSGFCMTMTLSNCSVSLSILISGGQPEMFHFASTLMLGLHPGVSK